MAREGGRRTRALRVQPRVNQVHDRDQGTCSCLMRLKVHAAVSRVACRRPPPPEHWPKDVSYTPFLLWSGDGFNVSPGDQLRLKTSTPFPNPFVSIRPLPPLHPSAERDQRCFGLYACRELDAELLLGDYTGIAQRQDGDSQHFSTSL